MCDEYNGWSNRPTWLANLHLSNDPDLYADAHTMARCAVAVAREEQGQDPDAALPADWHMGEMLEDWWEEDIIHAVLREDGDVHAALRTMALDVLLHWSAQVDWREVAEGWVADALEDAR